MWAVAAWAAAAAAAAALPALLPSCGRCICCERCLHRSVFSCVAMLVMLERQALACEEAASKVFALGPWGLEASNSTTSTHQRAIKEAAAASQTREPRLTAALQVAKQGLAGASSGSESIRIAGWIRPDPGGPAKPPNRPEFHPPCALRSRPLLPARCWQQFVFLWPLFCCCCGRVGHSRWKKLGC